jgi:aspartate aminotransferase-like enzyme
MRNKILLNPGPTNTRQETKDAQTHGSDVCHRTEEFYNVLSSVKTQILSLFSRENINMFECAVLGGSGTIGLEAMISSLAVDDTCIINAGIYGQRAVDMFNILKIKHREIKCNNIDDLVIDENIKLVYFVENETTTGEVFCVKKMCEMYPNAKFMIDSTSSFGASEYTGLTDRISAMSFCSNKCLQSTPGLGMVIWSKELPLYTRAYYCDLSKWLSSTPPFTLPVQAVYALHKTLSIISNNKDIFNRRRDNLIDSFSKLNIKCINKYPSNSIIGFQHPILTYEELHNILYNKDIVIYAGIPGIERSFRLSTMSVLFDDKFSNIIKSFDDTCIY